MLTFGPMLLHNLLHVQVCSQLPTHNAASTTHVFFDKIAPVELQEPISLDVPPLFPARPLLLWGAAGGQAGRGERGILYIVRGQASLCGGRACLAKETGRHRQGGREWAAAAGGGGDAGSRANPPPRGPEFFHPWCRGMLRRATTAATLFPCILLRARGARRRGDGRERASASDGFFFLFLYSHSPHLLDPKRQNASERAVTFPQPRRRVWRKGEKE